MLQPLQDITILDFSRLLPGPLATLLLKQMGARVIRIEHPKRSDLARQQPPFIGGQSTLFAALNLEKETVKIDYTTLVGKQQVFDLLDQADVIVEQFRPGTMDRWGLGYDALSEVKPDLVYVSLTGYGQSGPRASMAGHDINYLALAGLLDMNRDQNGKPVIPGVQWADICSGSSWCTTAVYSGLFHR
ncbi:MAG: CoA transferase, partial [Saprospiraceae bacterium]|nr:CoA transferase [Saprospiraceae bacterium]